MVTVVFHIKICKKSNFVEFIKNAGYEVEWTSLSMQGGNVTVFIQGAQQQQAQQIGISVCTELVKWLVANGWTNDDVIKQTLIARVRVHGKNEETGVTGQTLIRQYGMAQYVPKQDRVEWRETTQTTGIQ